LHLGFMIMGVPADLGLLGHQSPEPFPHPGHPQEVRRTRDFGQIPNSHDSWTLAIDRSRHYSNLDEVDSAASAALGVALNKVAKAMVRRLARTFAGP
jgi:hypothetical protein